MFWCWEFDRCPTGVVPTWSVGVASPERPDHPPEPSGTPGQAPFHIGVTNVTTSNTETSRVHRAALRGLRGGSPRPVGESGDRDLVTLEPGIGRRLLDHLIDTARQLGVEGLSLSVEDGNTARRLYERVGFTVVGRDGNSDTMSLTLGR